MLWSRCSKTRTDTDENTGTLTDTDGDTDEHRSESCFEIWNMLKGKEGKFLWR